MFAAPPVQPVMTNIAVVVAPSPNPAISLEHNLRVELRRARAENKQLRTRARLLARQNRRVFQPSVDHAIALAAAAYGVDRQAMRRVAWCESTHRPWAVNGQYVGLFQTGPAFWAHTPFTSFKRTDPYANALATAQVVAAQGWRQWECKP